MGLLFRNDMHDEFASLPLAYAPWGGADFGEVRRIGQVVGNGDDGAFFDAWIAAGGRLEAEADAALAAGHRASAREGLLRAASFYGCSYRPLFGAPADPRLVDGYTRQMAAFDRGLGLGEPAVVPAPIPFEGASMPAYLLPAEGRAAEVRPLLILTNGYDATVTDMYFASAVAASRRGYHCLFFDGPGQGDMLFRQGVAMRADWETVVAAVVDRALTLGVVDPDRIALGGWSLGGHLALRAASGEPRLAAVVADPGLWSITAPMRGMVKKLGVSDAEADRMLHGDSTVANRIGAMLVAHSPGMHWSVARRGYWVHGVEDFAGYLSAASAFTLEGRAGSIRCPVLLTEAVDDARSASAAQVLAALTCKATLLRFTAEEAASDHCEMGNRSLLNRRVFDWLDDVLG